jgi:hypothetical protein
MAHKVQNYMLKTMLFIKYLFSAGFLPLLSKNGGRTAANFLGQSLSFFGRFCVILQNFRPAGNSEGIWRNKTLCL